jgi:hypothetical protein
MDPEDIRQMIREELTAEKPVSSKKKREPSQWNKFLKECAPTHKDMPFGDRVRVCSVEYQDQKNSSSNKKINSVKQETVDNVSDDTE